jgi:hypothetical protein
MQEVDYTEYRCMKRHSDNLLWQQILTARATREKFRRVV